jgi:cyclophilin family peptidyl-prolyl cis-trans isomerase
VYLTIEALYQWLDHQTLIVLIVNFLYVLSLHHFLTDSTPVFGKVLEGMEFVDMIKRGDENNNGSVSDPDKIISFKSQ